MANLGTTFDATNVEPAKPLEVLPPGKYPAQIVNSEIRVTKDGTGQYLWLELDVLDGPLQGPQAVRSAQPRQCQSADRRDRAAHAIGHLSCHRPHAGAGQRGIAPDPVHRRRAGAAAEERLRRKQQGALPAARSGATPATPQPARIAPPQQAQPAAPAAAFTSAPWKRPA